MRVWVRVWVWVCAYPLCFDGGEGEDDDLKIILYSKIYAQSLVNQFNPTYTY